MSWLGFLAVVSALSTPTPHECATIEIAHEALLKSSFTATRDFTLTINGELKARQISRVAYATGDLEREVLSQELLDKNLVLDEEEELSALAVPFDCSRLKRASDGRYELTSPDQAERVVFELRDDETTLRPMSWRNNETVRFLWKKLEIEATTAWRDFLWQ